MVDQSSRNERKTSKASTLDSLIVEGRQAKEGERKKDIRTFAYEKILKLVLGPNQATHA